MRLVHDAPGARRRRKGDREKRNPGFCRRGGGCLEGVAVDAPSSPVT